jgi:hypothetical protein
MEPLMSNGSMHHRESKSEIDDTRDFAQGASCTIATAAAEQGCQLLRCCYGTRSPLQDMTRIIKITYWILMPH